MGLWSLSPDNDGKQRNRNSHPLLSLLHGCWLRNENPQASPREDDLFGKSGLLPPPWHEDSPPKGRGVKTELEVHTEQRESFPHICQNMASVWRAAQTSVFRRTPACCRHLQTPEVKNQEQRWCEPLWEPHPVWVNPLDRVCSVKFWASWLLTQIYLNYFSCRWVAPTLSISHGKSN